MSDDVSTWLEAFGPWAFYLVVWGLVFAGTGLFVGVFLPFLTGDSLLFAAGLVAGSTGTVDIRVLTAGVAVAAVAGDQLGYFLGRRYGRPYLTARRGRWVQAGVERSERFYHLFGWWSVVIGRYIPWGRVFVPAVAGVSGMAYWRFVGANVVGAFTWGVLITLMGYYAASYEAARPVAYGIAAVVILASVVAGIRAWRQDRRA